MFLVYRVIPPHHENSAAQGDVNTAIFHCREIVHVYIPFVCLAAIAVLPVSQQIHFVIATVKKK
jgi:hypothetical protein